MVGRWPRSYVATFRSPDFNPSVTNAHSVQSIGSGGDDYAESLGYFGDFYGEHMQMEVGVPGGWGTARKSLRAKNLQPTNGAPSPDLAEPEKGRFQGRCERGAAVSG